MEEGSSESNAGAALRALVSWAVRDRGEERGSTGLNLEISFGLAVCCLHLFIVSEAASLSCVSAAYALGLVWCLSFLSPRSLLEREIHWIVIGWLPLLNRQTLEHFDTLVHGCFATVFDLGAEESRMGSAGQLDRQPRRPPGLALFTEGDWCAPPAGLRVKSPENQVALLTAELEKE